MPDAKLIIRQPGEPVRKIRITPTDGDISIGRAQDNTIPLDGDTDASRYHAVISARRDGFYVSDLGSTNGTRVNGKSIRSHPIAAGDEITFGTLRVQLLPFDANGR